ncbi:MAG: glycosyltransferase family 9 protein [Kiritimatiellae bacterium]|nr:glycosyltransferase family 9 protein [Kiritimatiellia bacterium]
MKILIVKLSSLGDVLHALPTVHHLREGLNARIDWVVQKEYVDLVSHFSDVDRVIGFPRRQILGSLRPFLKELRQEPYDMVIDLQGLLKSAFVTAAARASRRIGPSFHREGSFFFYSEVAGERNLQRHAIDQIMDVLDHLKIQRQKVVFPIKIGAPELAGARPFLAIFPVSRWPSKNWPAKRFIEAGRRFLDQYHGKIFVLGAPGDATVCQTIANGIGNETESLAGQTSLVELTGILATMDHVLTNDSGPMHLAAAVGTPTAALFGPTDPRRTGPYGSNHTVLEANVDCRPCTHRTCRHQPTCMETISVQAVLDALNHKP